MKKWMYNVLICIFAAVFIVSGAMLAFYYWNAYVQESRYESLSQLRPSENDRTASGQVSPDGETASVVAEPETVEITDPKTGEKRRILVEFLELFKLNNDIVGWLTIPSIEINYPVMHTPDAPDYYLRRNFDKEKSNRGCLFVQPECDVFAPSDNITIYGHHMRDGSMFGQLDKFQDPHFRQENPYIYFDTLTALHTYEIISVFLTTATIGEGFAYHQFVNAEDETAFNHFIDMCKELELYSTGVEASYGDKLICLSTCEYSQSNGRLVVVAKRLT